MLLIRSARTLWGVTATLLTIVSELWIRSPSVGGTSFVLHSPAQIPQSDLGAVPAARLLEDSSQVIFDHWLRCMNG